MKTSHARYREKYERLNTLDTFQLIHLYKNHCETFNLPCCEKEIKDSEYETRSLILEILQKRLEAEYRQGEQV